MSEMRPTEMNLCITQHVSAGFITGAQGVDGNAVGTGSPRARGSAAEGIATTARAEPGD